MKTNFLKHFYILLFTSLPFLTSCDESDMGEIPEPTQEGTCRLTNLSYPDGSYNIDSEYNSKGYLVKETLNSKSATTQVVFIRTYSYNSIDQLIKVDVTRNGQNYRSATYDYANGRVSIVNNFNEVGELVSSIRLVYGSGDKIIKNLSSDGETTEFTHDANGNLMKAEHYNKEGVLSIKSIYDEYDTKHNWWRAIKKGSGLIENSISPNNPGREEITVYLDGEIIHYDAKRYTYKYNSTGWPIEQTTTDENNNSSVTNFSYKCD